MELSVYDIIVGPVISNKAYRLHQASKQIMFQVHVEANKPLVREAVTKLFNVEVDSIRIMVRKGKRRMSRTRNISVDATRKFAIVTLKNNHDINLFGNVVQEAEQAVTTSVKDVNTNTTKG